MNRVCIVSGGGSWGAFSVGKMHALNKDYDTVIGSSTGALMSPFIALGEWDLLKDLYTSITYDDIFSVNPFKKNGKLNIPKILFRLLIGKLTIGENENLYKLIKDNFTEEMYWKIIDSSKNVIITVCDINNRETKYISIRNTSYDDFCKYMWASASFPLVCNVVEINGVQYIDGGTIENSPLDYIIQDKVDELDMFMHSAPNPEPNKVTSIIGLAIRVIELMRGEIVKNDLNNIESDMIRDSLVNIYNIDAKPNYSYLTFRPDIMKEWYNTGYNSI